ncbi:APC family permease [Bacillus sp. Marseille-P3800]|uniref:APC family permease n=1 Tax=Bacillus sp. Marseille-P3800 TaxID=2014782 RepID=UPI00159B993D|nr:amino acid permease [Bacillus sp. Marseille-P3800]
MAKTSLKRTLSLWQVTALGLAWNTPMIYFSTFGVSYESASGQLLITYVLSFLAILLTGASYAKLAKKLPLSGSAYTYAKVTIHPNAGFLVGWVVLLNYLFAPIIACITFGVFLSAQFPSIPPFVWITSLLILLTVIAIRGVGASANISALFVAIQLLFIGGFGALLLFNLMQNGSTLPFTQTFAEPILSLDNPVHALIMGTSVVVFSFLGFDTITTLSEETKNPEKTIPRAIYMILFIVGGFHLSSSFFIQSSFPSLTFLNLDAAALEMMATVGGPILQGIFILVLTMAIFTQGLASITAVSRLLFAMGRDNLLPGRMFSYIHPTYNTPVFNILLSSTLSLTAIFLSVDTAMRFVNFGALTSFFFVNLCVISLAYKQKENVSYVKSYFVPAIAALIMMSLVSFLDSVTLTVGLIWMTIGCLYLLYLTKAFRHPLARWQTSKHSERTTV